MLLTEEEARKKWCPQVRRHTYAVESSPQGSVAVAKAGINRSDSGGPAKGSYCLASGCMEWRWAGGNIIFHPPYTPTPGTWPPQGYSLREDGHAERIDPLGYCGLASKPEEV